GLRLVVSCHEKAGETTVRLVDFATGEELTSHPRIGGIAFDAPRNRLAVGIANHKTERIAVIDLETGARQATIETLPGNSVANPHSRKSFSPDGHWLATTSGQEVVVWDIRQRSPLRNPAARLAGHAGPGIVMDWSAD